MRNARISTGRRVLAAMGLFFLLLVTGPLAAEGGGTVTAGPVHIEGLYSVGRGEFLDMLDIREGSPVDEAVVRRGIKRAFLKGIFEDIAVTVADGERPEVSIRVRERDFVSTVRVEGDYAVSRSIIRDIFPLKRDMVMRYDSLDSFIGELKKGLGRHGYPAASVSARVDKTSRPHWVAVVLHVDTGKPIIVREINLAFEPGFTPPPDIVDDIWNEIRIGTGDVYSEVRLEQNLRRIKDFLKRHGYFRPVLGPAAFRDGILNIPVNPGRHLDVRFEGNSAISEGTLRKELPFFETETFSDEMVDDAIDRMMGLYHAAGYPFAQIAPVISGDDRDLAVTFFVFEGEKIRVGAITFSGTTLPQDRLKGIMSMAEGRPYNVDSIDREKDTLREFYAALGYLDAVVRAIDVKVDREKGVADVRVVVEEGARTEIGSVAFAGVEEKDKAALAGVAGVKPGAPYNDVDIADARLRILDYYGSRGFTAVDVSVGRSIEDRKAAITFRVSEGEKRFFGDTVVVGNRQTRYEVIRREFSHRKGEPFNPRTIIEERQRLYRLGLFTDVEVDTLEHDGNSRDVVFTVNEGNAGSVEFGLGYGEFERYRGLAEVSYRNLWGMNRRGTFRMELSSLEKRFILQYKEPWFLGRPLPLRIFFLHENRRELNISTREILFRLNRYAINAGVERKLSENMKGELSYEFSIVRTSDVKPDVILTREDTGTIAISGIKPVLVYDTRDNQIDPRRGTLASISAKVASLVFLSEANFAKVEVHGARFAPLSSRATLAFSVRGGVTYGIGKTEQLPIVERFFLGGRTTVRGYAQDGLGPKGVDGNPTGGNAFLSGSIECRVNVGRGFGLVPFFDMGNVWLKAGEINPKDLKYTTGMGLRYSTPVGPLSIDYGVKLNRQYGESRGELHFSVGQAF